MQTETNFSESFSAIYGDETAFLEKTLLDCPASSLPIFLLLQKYKSSDEARFEQLIKKGALYFSNQNWLRFQLLQEPTASENNVSNISSWKVEEEEEEDTAEEALEISEDYSAIDEATPDPSDESQAPDKLMPGLPAETEIAEVIEPTTTLLSLTETEMVAETQRPETPVETESEIVEAEGETALIDPENLPSAENEINESVPEALTLPEDVAELATPPIEIPETTEATDPESETGREGEKIDQPNIEIITTREPSEIPVPGAPVEVMPPAAENKAEDTEITFEPLHTMDYFASQGIIIREEALLNDKLGKQMKSFTDWLKSMKKLHPGKLPEQNEVVEKIIQSSAELSNEDAGVLTEAMAEVLLKQGKSEKAIEMYEKLSLMNPLKSIYFAAKIESLKN